MKRSILRSLAFTAAVVVVLVAQSKPAYTVPPNNQKCSSASTFCPCVYGEVLDSETGQVIKGCYPLAGFAIYQCQPQQDANCTLFDTNCVGTFRVSVCKVRVNGNTFCENTAAFPGAPVMTVTYNNCAP